MEKGRRPGILPNFWDVPGTSPRSVEEMSGTYARDVREMCGHFRLLSVFFREISGTFSHFLLWFPRCPSPRLPRNVGHIKSDWVTKAVIAMYLWAGFVLRKYALPQIVVNKF